MTMANMDGHMDMAKHYDTTTDGRVVGLKPAPPFSNDELKVCPTCRGQFRSISRYGRIVRRALLDESTKKFIVWSNKIYCGLQSQFQAAQDQLSATSETVAIGTTASVELQLSGSPTAQFKRLQETAGALMIQSRYAQVFQLRKSIHAHVKKVKKEEQPFKRVHDFCQDARRRREITGSFDFDQEVLQTRAHLLASALLLRCDLVLIADIVSIWRDKLPVHLHAKALVNLSASRTRCLELLAIAGATNSPAQQVEALIAYAQLNAIERPFAASPNTQDELREEALIHITTARALCAVHPGSTAGLSDEVDTVERMLRAETFFSVVTSEERRAVLAAMATEFRGTGHWYYCENGHPFTVGECGMPMQQTACPQCGAPAGGMDHAPAAGVRRAEDLEEELETLHL
ncbi:E3 ubiquitin-protein ligase rnf213-alpha [Lasiodiplodia hormozganensis]|uniref:E3 ubiquitin-protein ligase rnf213-alpha n=1 Tax=Lasiodiplodia hormozganensis TaxID=869390 RepID=A0AA40C1Q5_9PEZI|nr:E3 ubiquitin-protein ligase rnf213-alpha [Lasiodiplodia hormozganensis]